MLEIKIGSVLKKLLHEQRRTLKEVSKETQIPYSTLYTWFENRQPKDILKVQCLAEFLGVSLHYLLFGKEDKEPLLPQELVDSLKDEVFKGVFEIVVRKVE